MEENYKKKEKDKKNKHPTPRNILLNCFGIYFF